MRFGCTFLTGISLEEQRFGAVTGVYQRCTPPDWALLGMVPARSSFLAWKLPVYSSIAPENTGWSQTAWNPFEPTLMDKGRAMSSAKTSSWDGVQTPSGVVLLHVQPEKWVRLHIQISIFHMEDNIVLPCVWQNTRLGMWLFWDCFFSEMFVLVNFEGGERRSLSLSHD